MEWKELKQRIQSIKPTDFEKLVAALLTSFFQIPFVVARSGDQPRGDARSISSDVSMQAKRYTGKNLPDVKTIEGDIGQARRAPALHLQVYVLAVSRDTEQLSYELNAIARETGLDIVTLELTDEPSDLGALCVTFWEDICHFFDLSNTNQEFSAWVQIAKDDSKTHDKIKDVRNKLENGIQTQKHVQKDVEKYLLERFSREKGFNPINLSQAIERKSLESQVADWWKTEEPSVCCLEGKEGHGKSWLAAKWMRAICKNENVVTFWLDSKDWKGSKSIFDLLRTCFSLIYPSYEQGKIAKLQNKPAKIWHKTLIVLDGVNERNALEAAQWILTEYFRNDESEWGDRIRFLLTTRPLDDYPDFENYLWDSIHKISVGPFNDFELEEALARNGLQFDDLPDSLKDIARIPRYFQTCIRLRNQFRSFEAVTKEMILWEDLLYKIKHTPQIRKNIGWSRVEDAQDILAKLAQEAKWTNVDDAPKASLELLIDCFSSNYHEIRQDFEEQRITLRSGKIDAELSEDHILLGWALYLANLFDCREFTGIKNFAEAFQNTLEPIPSEDLRTKALFVALQITAISLDPKISQDQLSQKRAALMLAWFHSHNAQITDKQLSFWGEEDTDAYAQVVEFEFEHHNSPNYEDALIEPLAKIWLGEKGQIDRLALCLKKWIFPPVLDVDYISPEEDSFPTMYYTRNRLLAAALSILSQRRDRQFLEKLARCYENLPADLQFKENIGRLMRWTYTETVLDDLCSLAERAQDDTSLLNGIYGLAYSLRVDLPQILERPLTEEDVEIRASVEQWNRRFKSYIDRIRDQEKLLTGESPADNVKGNYHGLGYLAVRTDLPDLYSEDLVEIKGVLHYIT